MKYSFKLPVCACAVFAVNESPEPAGFGCILDYVDSVGEDLVPGFLRQLNFKVDVETGCEMPTSLKPHAAALSMSSFTALHQPAIRMF